MSAWPVRKITGNGFSVWAKNFCKSRPVRPGIFKSTSTQPRAAVESSFRKALAESKLLTAKPIPRSNRHIAARKDASSSITKTVCSDIVSTASRRGSDGNRPLRGQSEAEGRALVRIVARSNGAAVGFDNGPGNGQPHSHAVCFGGEEWFEYPGEPLLAEAFAKIAHGNLDHPFVILLRGNSDFA